MKKFEMESPIVMEDKESIAEALREIADAIESGVERDWVPGEAQCAEWFIFDEDEEYEDEYEEDYENEY
jgi:hypothetical protein